MFLNEPIQIDFSNDVDLSTADLNTVSFQVFDLNGTALNERPAGTFALARAAGDQDVGRRLLFSPRFPTNDTFDNGGFKPGRLYVVSLVGGDQRNNTVLKDTTGRPLSDPVSFQFRTADGSTPSELFSDTLPGGPRRSGFSVSPSTGGTTPVASLNLFGREPVEVRLSFDQPLNPQSTNVPVDISADPLQRDPSARGRIFLEYDDPAEPRAWIPATVELAANTRAGSVVILRPIGVLPNNASIRVVVENTVEDMSGESNVSDPAYNRVFASFTTTTDFPPQYDALVENFVQGSGTLDPGAAFLEPFAQIQDGRLSASFDFEGTSTTLEYQPTVREVILNTDFTTITPRNSPPINVTGGVFNFSQVTINESVTVRGSGTNPMVWLCSGDFTVNGTLTVDGGDGERVDTLNSANFPTPGGIGACGGGNGGRGSPNATDRSQSGEAGYGPKQRPGGGGEGGRLSCTSTCNRGSGGGGGSLGAKGDPYYPPNSTMTWGQVMGDGGRGCLNRSLPGGAAGPTPFTDSRPENNFWGTGVNVWRSIRIQGELLIPTGGAGGGGGGDRAPSCNSGDPNFASDNKGGGGGAGAGVLIVKALGTIRVGPNGHIDAVGGNGGGGEQAGGNDEGGGGGGGSGGMIVLMAGRGFELYVHGNENSMHSTYGELDYNFSVSADGGIGTQGVFSGTEIANKYPPGNASTWDARPTGGFGGLGIVQLMAPPGDDADGTGNRLDDNIDFVYFDTTGTRVSVSPARKKQLLAWRGWPDVDGMLKDDDGNLTNIGKMEGDIRPSPVMLPSPFGALSRARSRWVDLGFAVRQPVVGTPDPNAARVVQVGAGEDPPSPDFGDPGFGYAGTLTSLNELGYVAYDQAKQSYPIVQFNGMTALPILSVDTGAMFDGQPAYTITLDPSVSLGTVDNRYADYRLQVLDDQGAVIGSTGSTGGPIEYRILAHTERTLVVEPGETFPTAAARSIRVAAKFFEVFAQSNRESLGEVGTTGAPTSNVRIGFAFNTDPSDTTNGMRYPASPGQFAFDLRDPALLTFLQSERPKYVQWDVLFNIRYDPQTSDNISGQPLSSTRILPALNYLVLPYRF